MPKGNKKIKSMKKNKKNKTNKNKYKTKNRTKKTNCKNIGSVKEYIQKINNLTEQVRKDNAKKINK
jgi:hypothetical protein